MIDFAGNKIDALLISSLPNIRYLTGFTGSNGVALLSPESMTLFTDPRYTTQSHEEVKAAGKRARIQIAKGPLQAPVVQAIGRLRFRRIGFEKDHLTYGAYQALKEALPLGSSLRAVGGLIEKLRMVKTEDEIARIRASVIANSEAFATVVKRIRVGARESEIAAGLEYQMRKRGAEGPAFESIVACGARTALPHARPTGQALGANQLLLIDMGACRNGYMSDMTRMLYTGNPGKGTSALYRAVLDAQLAAIAAVRPGIAAERVDRAARSVLKEAGLDKQFIHSTGHGLGLEIHEAPRVGRKIKTRLETGMVITIEPGAYVPGEGGVRIEDTVLVTDKGCEVLTPTTKELILL